jgi:hypothetical protein
LKNVIHDNANYQEKKPFPHAVVDDLFPIHLLEAVDLEIVDNPDLKEAGCAKDSSACFIKEKDENK